MDSSNADSAEAVSMETDTAFTAAQQGDNDIVLETSTREIVLALKPLLISKCVKHVSNHWRKILN